MPNRSISAAVVLAATAAGALAQTAPQIPAAPPAKMFEAPTPPMPVTMKKLAAHYVEGPGYVTFFHNQTKGYGGTYAECERNCLADNRCRMIEFYKPLRKCHLYDHTKWSGKASTADVALKTGG